MTNSQIVFEQMQRESLNKHFSLLTQYQSGGLSRYMGKQIHDIIWVFLGHQVNVGITLDFRWSQRRNALNGTLTVRTFGGFLLGRTHINRTVSDKGTTDTRSFVGAAKNMEGAAVKKFLEYISLDYIDHRINISGFVHDQDGCTAKLIREIFPTSTEYLDIGHVAKNLKKKVAKQVPGYGEKACAAFRKCVKAFPNIADRTHALKAYP